MTTHGTTHGQAGHPGSASLRRHGKPHATAGHGIATGRAHPCDRSRIAVLTVASAALRRPRVDAGGTRLRLRALHVMGHGPARIARAAGASDKTIRALVRGDAKTISVGLRATIATIYDAWRDKRAPERTAPERAAATTARRMAIRGSWCAGTALDDDLLDIPGYKPSYGWRPAWGTGTASAFPQPVLQRRPRPLHPGTPT